MESVAQAVSNLAIQFGDSDNDGNAMSRCFFFPIYLHLIFVEVGGRGALSAAEVGRMTKIPKSIEYVRLKLFYKCGIYLGQKLNNAIKTI